VPTYCWIRELDSCACRSKKGVEVVNSGAECVLVVLFAFENLYLDLHVTAFILVWYILLSLSEHHQELCPCDMSKEMRIKLLNAVIRESLQAWRIVGTLLLANIS